MAAVTFSTVDAAMATLFAPRITKAINRSIVLGQLLAVVPADSKAVNWQAKFGVAEAPTPTFNDGADISTFNNDTRFPATLAYARYYDAFSISGFARAAARVTANPQQMEDLFGDELTDSIERYSRAIAKDLYAGTGATNIIHGLYASVPAIGDTGVYAGIDRSVQTQWQGTVVDAAVGDISLPKVQDLNRRIYTAAGKHVDIYVTDATQFMKLGLQYGSQRRYHQMVDVPNADGRRIKLDGGWNALEVDGRPCLEDVQSSSGKFAGLNMNEIRIRQMPDTIDEINRAIGNVQGAGTPEDQLGPGRMRISARLQPIATTGDAQKFALIGYPQLQVRDPRCHGYLTNLNTAVG